MSSFGEQDFKAAVNKVKDYVMAGDVMQVVPSQRLSAPFHAAPINLYRALRRLNPSPYMYFWISMAFILWARRQRCWPVSKMVRSLCDP